MTTWTLIRFRDVVSYLYSLRDAGSELRAAIQSLEHGIPEDAEKIQEEPELPETSELWEWLQAYHWITFIVDHEARDITIIGVERVEL